MADKDLKILGNYSTQSNNGFPLDCETLEYIQNNAALCEVLGNIAGDKVILYGCELYSNNTQRRSGYVFVRTTEYPQGEVLYFSGGAVASGMYVRKENIAVRADNVNYSSAYTKRWMEPGLGSEQFQWKDFAALKSTRELSGLIEGIQKQLDTLSGNPIGTILIWPGASAPSDQYVVCDGRPLNKIKYSVLYSIVGERYKEGEYTPEGEFRIPNIKGRFVAGLSGDSFYPQLGHTGGDNNVELEVRHLPEHSHTYQKAVNVVTRTGNSQNNKFGSYETANTGIVGGGESHENRPPFIVLNYIIKVS